MSDRPVDAHHHLLDPARRHYEWLDHEDRAPIRRRYDMTDLRVHTDATGVTRTVLVQTVHDVDETEEFLAVADANRDLLAGVVGWVDLTDPALLDTVARLRAGAGGDLLVGFRHQAQAEPDPEWLARPDVVAGARAVGDAGLAYDVLVRSHQLPAAIDLVRQAPDCRFVLDHMGNAPMDAGELEPWAGLIRELAGLPNVACKLSGLVGEGWSVAGIQPYADVVLTAFGTDRVMFGSDWPVCELAASYEDVLGLARELCAGLTERERADVFSGTATAWYRLPT
ncbi:MAG TPA: amidohydrolase family protein [Pseudonocardiaceae bacterium]|nr:amidohydrolase family protein [Pseudonocardiaceae bacterium]